MTTSTPDLLQPAPLREDTERVPHESALSPWISVDPARMHGEPCFKGTRIPIQTLFDHLRHGDPIGAFIDGFPDVTKEQAVAIIDLAAAGLLEGLRQL